MAEDSMLNLFDSEATSFLDELTGQNLNPSGMMGSGMDPAEIGMPAQPMHQNFPQVSPGGASLHHGSAATQKLHHMDSYDRQFTSQGGMMQHSVGIMPMQSPGSMPNQIMAGQAMMGNMPPSSPGMPNVRSPGLVGRPQPMMSPQNPGGQFGSPPPGSPRMPHPSQPNYNYPMHTGNVRMPQPGMMSQASNWGQQQPQQLSPGGSYIQQQQQQHQQQQQMQTQQQQNYMGHHDYMMSNSQSQRLAHYGPQPGQQGSYMSGQPGGRLTHMPSSINSQIPMSMSSVQNYPSMNNQSTVTYQYVSQGGQSLRPPAYRAASNGPQRMPAMMRTPGTNVQQYRLNTAAQQQQQPTPQSAQQQMPTSASGPLSHFQATGPNIPAPYRPSYGGMRQTTPSPRPQQSSPQSSLSQSSLQQLEKMVPTQQPGSQLSPSSFQTYPQTSSAPAMHVNTSLASAPGMSVGQVSPNVASRTGQMQMQSNALNQEIQQLKQQVAQIFKMQQTPETQQQMLDMQERLRTLQAQQQLQQQQLQQQIQQQPLPGQMLPGQHHPGQPRMQQPGQPTPQPIQQQQQQQQQLPLQQNVPLRPQQPPQVVQVRPIAPQSQVQPRQFSPQKQQHELQSQQQVVLPQSPQKTVSIMTQNVPILPAPAKTAGQQSAEAVVAMPVATSTPTKTEKKKKRPSKSAKGQDKANLIIQEAIQKAKAAGTDVPNVVQGAIPTTVTEEMVPLSVESKEKLAKTPKEKKPKPEKKPKVIKPKPAPKKKKPPATFISTKKKRKRADSSEGSDLELPPSSPSVDENVFKRRSSRNTNKRKKYLDAPDLNLSDEENQDVDVEGVNAAAAQAGQMFMDNPAEEDAVIVEKILGMRMGKRMVSKKPLAEDVGDETKEAEEEEDTEEEEVEVEEFFVKYKNFSYLHCEWRTAEELRDKRIQSKIKRYKMKRLQQNSYFAQLDEDELFNPAYVEVDRVLTMSTTSDPTTGEEATHYLVKWCALPYEDSTWELEQDVDRVKIQEYLRFKDPPPDEEQEFKERPEPKDWQKIQETKCYKNDNKLREYQEEGVNWLLFSWHNSQNCILADEMGLGKTVQSITFLQEVVNYGIRGPFLIIAPLSTIANWQREFETWTDLNVITYHGTSPSRNMLQEYEMYYKDENGFRIQDVYKFHALITTYEIILSDMEVLNPIDWRVTIIDEAHRLKNQNCKLMHGLKLFSLEHRVLLTGTPLQNNIEELFSLLSFLEPNRFKSSDAFTAEFGVLQTETQVEKLKAILKPMMLRRLKEDVEKNLAPKEETIVEVELTNIQKKYYRAILEKNFSFLSKTSAGNLPSLMNTMMELRKCCNHPYLVNGAEEQILEENRQAPGMAPDPDKLFNVLIQSSGKLVLIDKLLAKLKAGNHKVLVFSQMIRVLDILEDYLIHRKYQYERIDGRITGNTRQEAIDRFSKPDSDKFVFLLCTRAGGLGINLTAADTVIIYDSDWNPQNDLQAQARCHRIGQQKSVKVYRLICRNTYEREMFDRASKKLGLDKAVLQSMGGKESIGQQNQLSKKEVEDLLKKGAYGALMEDETAGDKFCEEDIDQILQRRTQVIQIESVGKGSTFAKASFAQSGNRSDIDINDPNFWQKWAKKADIDVDAHKKRNNLIIEEPRMRKQTARYGNQDAMNLSELESTEDSDEEESTTTMVTRKRRGRRRKRDDDFEGYEAEEGTFARSECFKVEKNLLVYGWGRFDDILTHGRFKKKLSLEDVRTIARALLLYSLRQYKGDEKIKSFIWDLVASANGSEEGLVNHAGLSAPVPRGRKTKNKVPKDPKVSRLPQDDEMVQLARLDPDVILADDGYKKHLHRHANKVLLRVRLLYYLKQEVIGDQAEKVFQNLPASEIDIPPPCPEQDPPTFWWNEEADKSLLIGVFKYGYEKYNLIRQDPALIFLAKCGPPDGKALLAEQNDEDDDDEDPEFKPANRNRLFKDDLEDLSVDSPASEMTPTKVPPAMDTSSADNSDKLPWPTPSDLNTRLRRVITGYQKNLKRLQLENEKRAKKMMRHERATAVLHERELQRLEQKQRWTRREEAEFYRVVSTFGVEFDPRQRLYTWNTFRRLARLERKWDETLTEYFLAFYYMCKKVCHKVDKDERPPNNLYIEAITEERAARCLARIDLLNEIREEVLWHPKLEERLKLCRSSLDLPVWWVNGEHDKDLLIGAAKHGLVRTDYHIQYDPKLCFRELIKNQTDQVRLGSSQGFQVLSNGSQEKLFKEEKSKAVVDEKPIKVEEPVIKSETASSKDIEVGVKQEDSPSEGAKTSDVLLSDVKPGDIKSETTDTDVEMAEEKGSVDEKEIKTEPAEEKEVAREGEDVEHEVKSEEATVNNGSGEDEGVKAEEKEETDSMPTLEPEMENQDSRAESTACTEPGDLTVMDADKDSSVVDILAQTLHNRSMQWPKDRVIFLRLEQVCHCIKTGEWNTTRKSSYNPYDSLSATPIGTPSAPPRTDTPEYSFVDTPDSMSGFKGEGLKLTIHKRRGRRRKAEIEMERNARLRALMGTPSMASSDGEHSESSMSAMNVSDMVNGRSAADLFGLGRDVDSEGSLLQEEGDVPVKKKRGRKRKADKLAEQALAEALSMRRHTAGRTSFDPEMVLAQASLHQASLLFAETRVPVINLKDGSRLSGDQAPMRKDLEEWLEEHPGYMVEAAEDEEGMLDKRRRRRPRLDPLRLDPDHITGDENVSVINRETGKKITGAKAPPIKHLALWLKQNPTFDVDPKWAHIVKEKADIPDELKDRIRLPSDRGRRSMPSSSLLPPELQFPGTSGLGALPSLTNPAMLSAMHKFPLNVPFGGLPSMGLMSSMMGLPNFPFPVVSTANSDSASDRKSPKDSSKRKSDSPGSSSNAAVAAAAAAEAAAATSAAAFPFMYNPFMYHSLLAAQGLAGFSLPTSLPTSFATLAQAGLANGLKESEETEESARKSEGEQEEAQDLSVKKTVEPEKTREGGQSSSEHKHSKEKHGHHHHHHRKHKDRHGDHSSQRKTDSSSQSSSSRKKIERIAEALAIKQNKDGVAEDSHPEPTKDKGRISSPVPSVSEPKNDGETLEKSEAVDASNVAASALVVEEMKSDKAENVVDVEMGCESGEVDDVKESVDN